MTEQDEWTIDGRDVFIDRWGDNGIETMTVKEAEAMLNEYETLKKATEALSAEDARFASRRIDGTWDDDEGTIESLEEYADILKDG